MNTEDRQALAIQIHDFIEKYAKIAAAYDPDYDAPDERFNGPDSSMLNHAAVQLERGDTIETVSSTFGSGCYRGDAGVAQLHDSLVAQVNALWLRKTD